MSRAALALVCWATLGAGQGFAQDASNFRLPAAGDVSATAPQAAPAARSGRDSIAQNLLTPTKRERCIQGSGEGIVVCGHNAENDRQKLPIENRPDGAGLTADGAPRAPSVSGLRDCSRGCIGFGSAPVPMYFFDIKALPEAPAGSDADRIAKGEIKAP